MKYITFTKKSGKFDTSIDPIELNNRIDAINLEFADNENQMDGLRKAQAELDKELQNLLFIKNQIK